MTPLWWCPLVGVGMGVVWAWREAFVIDKQLSDAARDRAEIELPTWSDADEHAADESYNRALREWQQSVEVPSHPRPRLSVVGVARLRRDLSKPVKLTQAEAEHVREILFPRSRRQKPEEVA